MSDNYIRCLTRVIPVDETWAEGYTEPHVIASVNIAKRRKQYVVRVTVIDKASSSYEISHTVDSLSSAATLYDQLLETVFNVIPNNVTPTWLLDNGFSPKE